MARLSIKSIPAGIVLSVEEVTRIADRATELLRAFQARIDSLRGQVEAAKQRFHEEAEELVRDATPENRNNARAYSKHAAATKFSKFRANIVSNSYASRQELLEPLAKHAEHATFLLQMFASPAQALGRVALGDTRRTQIQLQLTGAGPVELESAAALAVTTRDVVMAAAIVTVVDRLPSKDRPFSVNEFATIMWGEQHIDVVTKLRTVLQAYKLADIAEKEFRTSEVNNVSRLSALLDQREIEATAGRNRDAG